MLRRVPLRSKASTPLRESRVDRTDEFASFVIEPTPSRMAAQIDLEDAAPVPKEDYFYSEAWRRAVAGLPCVLCGRVDVQAAHRNEGKAGGKKLMDDCWTAALCLLCHALIDQGRDDTRDERRRRMDLAILLTIRALARAGQLRVVAK